MLGHDAEMNQSPPRVVRHIVLLSFRQGTSEQTIAAIGAAFLGLQHEIPQIHAIEWGEDVSPEGRQGGHTHAFMVTFASERDRDAYLPMPPRQTFIADVLRPHLEKATVVDYVARSA